MAPARAKRVRIAPAQAEKKRGTAASSSSTPEESQVERCENQNNANVHCQPFPESVSEEREIHTDDDGCHCHRVKRDGDLPARFRLHGLYFKGRDKFLKTSGGPHVELAPNKESCTPGEPAAGLPGVYSIAKFELVAQGSGTKIVFDHTGFPKGEAEVLASGWKAHYWEPLENSWLRSARDAVIRTGRSTGNH